MLAIDGCLRWRRQLGRLQPLLFQVGQGRLTVAPDGSRVFLRVVTISPSNRGETFFTNSVRVFDSATGEEATPAAASIGDAAFVLPLSAERLLIATRMGELDLISLDQSGSADAWIMDGPTQTSLHETAVFAVLLPDGKTIYALGQDLTLLIIDVLPDGMQLRERIDMVEPGGFFFEHVAMSPDGQTIAVG